jgi:hypothetical protein
VGVAAFGVKVPVGACGAVAGPFDGTAVPIFDAVVGNVVTIGSLVGAIVGGTVPYVSFVGVPVNGAEVLSGAG